MTLAALQDAMHGFLTGGNLPPELEQAVAPSALPARARLQIHANNFSLSLASVLASTFPLVEAFVGEEFFAALAREYVKKDPPGAPMLFAWGGGFSRFLADFPHASDTPYLADLAALEWAIHVSADAVEEALAGPETPLQDIKVSSSAILVESRWPLMMLWMVGQGQLQPEAINLDGAGQNILVVRKGGAVRLHVLDDKETALLKLLREDLAGNWSVNGEGKVPLDGL